MHVSVFNNSVIAITCLEVYNVLPKSSSPEIVKSYQRKLYFHSIIWRKKPLYAEFVLPWVENLFVILVGLWNQVSIGHATGKRRYNHLFRELSRQSKIPLGLFACPTLLLWLIYLIYIQMLKKKKRVVRWKHKKTSSMKRMKFTAKVIDFDSQDGKRPNWK